MPTVSIIIPVYNCVRYLREAIESALSQTYGDWELLLVDDGSTDDSVDLADEYVNRFAPKVRLLFHPDRKNHGVSASRNLAIEKASGKYIAFLDADDVWLPHRLEVQIKALERHPEVGLIYGNSLCVDENSQEFTQPSVPYRSMREVGCGVPYQPSHVYEGFFLERDWFAPVSTVMVRRTLLLEAGGFALDLKLRGGEDVIMWVLVAKRAPVLYLSERLALYRVHNTNWSSKQTPVSAADSHLEIFTWLATHTRQMDKPMAEAMVQLIHRYWRLHHVSLRLRISKIREVIRWLRAYGRLKEVLPRYVVRRIKRMVRQMFQPRAKTGGSLTAKQNVQAPKVPGAGER